MRRFILCCVLCLGLMPAQAQVSLRDAQMLNEVGSRGQLFSASALLYFNPALRESDPRALAAAHHHLQTLDTTVLHLGQPSGLLQPVRAMQSIFAQLDSLPSRQRERYPQLVQQLIQQQRVLLRAVNDFQAPLSPAEIQARLPINAQSNALASLLLDYQLRHYPLPDKAGLLLSNEALQALDSTIKARFESLITGHPEHAAALRKINSSYQFVHAELLQNSGAAHGGVEFYLGRAVTDLDELAMTVAAEGTSMAVTGTKPADAD